MSPSVIDATVGTSPVAQGEGREGAAPSLDRIECPLGHRPDYVAIESSACGCPSDWPAELRAPGGLWMALPLEICSTCIRMPMLPCPGCGEQARFAQAVSRG